MAEARNYKYQEYNTHITAHDAPRTQEMAKGVRASNTFKSTALVQEPDVRFEPKCVNKREHIFQDRPISAQVTRASYQDSNIFNYKSDYGDRNHGESIQKSAKNPPK